MSQIKIEKKKVSIDKKMFEILRIYSECLTLVKVPEDEMPLLVAASEVKKKGGFGNSIKRFLEGAFDTHLGSIYVEFSKEEINVNQAAKQIYDAYTRFTIKLHDLAKKSSKQNAKEEVDSAFILSTYLLKRMAAFAFCSDTNKYDGQKYVQAIKSFATKILKSEYIREHNDFCATVQTDHPGWVDVFSRVVEFTNIIKAPKEAFGKILNYLQQVKKVTMMQIAAFLTKVTEQDLGEEELVKTLISAENKALKIKDDLRDIYSDHTLLSDDEISTLIRKKNDKTGYLRSRYELLEKLGYMYKITSALDITTAATGWAMFFIGAIDVDAIKQHMNWFDNFATERLNVQKADFNGNLKSYKALTDAQGLNIGYKEDFFASMKNLDLLNNESVLKLLGNYLKDAIQSIDENQQALGIEGIKPIIRPGLTKMLPDIARKDAIEKGKEELYEDTNLPGLGYGKVKQTLELKPNHPGRHPLKISMTDDQIILSNAPKEMKQTNKIVIRFNQNVKEILALHKAKPHSDVLAPTAADSLILLLMLHKKVMEKAGNNLHDTSAQSSISIKVKYNHWFHENLNNICNAFYILDKIYRDRYHHMTAQEKRKYKKLDYTGGMNDITSYNEFLHQQSQAEDVTIDDSSDNNDINKTNKNIKTPFDKDDVEMDKITHIPTSSANINPFANDPSVIEITPNTVDDNTKPKRKCC